MEPWLELVGAGWSWLEVVDGGWCWLELVGAGRSSWELVGAGWGWLGPRSPRKASWPWPCPWPCRGCSPMCLRHMGNRPWWRHQGLARSTSPQARTASILDMARAMSRMLAVLA